MIPQLQEAIVAPKRTNGYNGIHQVQMQSELRADKADPLTQAYEIYQKLLTEQQSAILSTINADNSPQVSYAPFVIDQAQNFYIFVSTNAQHTDNLTRNGQTSLMLIADEAQTQQIFARHRLTLSCQATAIARDSDAWQTASALYEARFPDMFKQLRCFSDFWMFRLVPQQGRIIVGFGQAYEIGGEKLDVLTHYGKGHDLIEGGGTTMSTDSVLSREQIEGAICHMNEDHPHNLLDYAHTLAGLIWAEEVEMSGLDIEGFDLIVRGAAQTQQVRIPFDLSLTSADQLRPAMVALAVRARKQ